ncbi:hypothetical protein BD65_365 [Yersinia ruckeri]|nr:hypothetical protein BD65_365 [Yersinia ruckeri]
MIGYAIRIRNYSVAQDLRGGKVGEASSVGRMGQPKAAPMQLFEQIGADGQVATALILPLARHMIVLGAFGCGTFCHFL